MVTLHYITFSEVIITARTDILVDVESNYLCLSTCQKKVTSVLTYSFQTNLRLKTCDSPTDKVFVISAFDGWSRPERDRWSTTGPASDAVTG